jgi:ketosteroid isomerase-like protein
MRVDDVVDAYYDAWINKAGDLSDVPIAPDVQMRGPLEDADGAEQFRALARRAGEVLSSIRVRAQFYDGNRVCSILDWQLRLPIAPITVAEVLEVHDGRIVRGETIYDTAELRTALALFGG